MGFMLTLFLEEVDLSTGTYLLPLVLLITSYEMKCISFFNCDASIGSTSTKMKFHLRYFFSFLV